MSRVLVCGSRTWTDGNAIRRRLTTIPPGSVIVTGGARGADQLAETVARSMGFTVETYPADWRGKGRRAGIVRNLEMLDSRPSLVIGFQKDGSRGTQHTLDEAQRRGIRTWRVTDHSAAARLDRCT